MTKQPSNAELLGADCRSGYPDQDLGPEASLVASMLRFRV
jgi:hypothetical protein